jgi:hypothetical protein
VGRTLTASAEKIAAQVNVVAERVPATIEQRRADRPPAGRDEPGWKMAEIKLVFRRTV